MFTVDKGIVHSQQAFTDALPSSKTGKDQAKMIANAIKQCLAGECPLSIAESEQKDLVQKYEAGGMNAITPSKRPLLTTDYLDKVKADKNEKTLTRLKAKIRDHKAAGKTWKQINQVLHISARYPEFKEMLKTIFNSDAL